MNVTNPSTGVTVVIVGCDFDAIIGNAGVVGQE